jgi:hypothetical protein
MRRVQIAKPSSARSRPLPADLRSPSGRALPL